MTQLYFYLFDYAKTDIPDQTIDNMQKVFDELRSRGMQVVLRFAFDDAVRPQLPYTVADVQRTIKRVAPLVEKNKDVVSVWQAGFIGAWGEWAPNYYNHQLWPDAVNVIMNTLIANLPGRDLHADAVPVAEGHDHRPGSQGADRIQQRLCDPRQGALRLLRPHPAGLRLGAGCCARRDRRRRDALGQGAVDRPSGVERGHPRRHGSPAPPEHALRDVLAVAQRDRHAPRLAFDDPLPGEVGRAAAAAGPCLLLRTEALAVRIPA